MSEKKKRKKKLKPIHLFAYLFMAIQIILFAALTVPSLFSYRPYAITSDNMKPAISKGNIVYVRNSDPALLESGDIICFFPEEASLKPMTERVANNDQTNRYLELKSDNGETQESIRIPYSSYSGKVCHHLPLLGYLGQFLSTTIGKILYMLLFDAMILLIWLF